LTALVITQTLRHGPVEGAKVAIAPLVTDGPLLLGSAWLAGALGERGLGVISLIGAAFLTWLGWETVKAQPPGIEPGPPGSVWKAIGTNLLNPHPYVFWIAVGGPLIATAENVPLWLVGFFGGLCGSKVAMALGIGHFRDRLNPRLWRVALVLLGLAMFGFAVAFAVDGVQTFMEPAAG